MGDESTFVAHRKYVHFLRLFFDKKNCAVYSVHIYIDIHLA